MPALTETSSSTVGGSAEEREMVNSLVQNRDSYTPLGAGHFLKIAIP